MLRRPEYRISFPLSWHYRYEQSSWKNMRGGVALYAIAYLE